uniref:Lipocalin/cytosolic fatty-acid binding domain-containing protein n=1 Tax=Gouania willdenowi TaxID=441366 RepID=A0A8C5H682_GOUWI
KCHFHEAVFLCWGFFGYAAENTFMIMNCLLLLTVYVSDGTIGSAVGNATVKDPAEPDKLEVVLNESSPPGPYWVLSTDYDNYGCTNLGLTHNEYAWILSREPTLHNEILKDLMTLTALPLGPEQ